MSRKSQKGQGLVEFALMLPILLMLILGIFEAARVVWAFITVQNAAREAARYAVTGRPFYCDGDIDGNGVLPPPSPLSYTDFIAPATCENGSPWSSQVVTATRVQAIELIAIERGKNLTGDFAKGEKEWVSAGGQPATGIWPNPLIPPVPGTFGVRVLGSTSSGTVLVDFAGKPGTNVRVDTFYHVQMIDPIYDTIMGGSVIPLTGSVELQNEGDNPDNPEGQLTGITGNPPGEAIPGGNVPYIIVSDPFGDRAEPAGGSFTVYIRQHAALTEYHIWFVDVNSGYSAEVTVNTDVSGDAIKVFGIPTNAPPTGGSIGSKSYRIYTTTGGKDIAPTAACDNSATNAPCFEVTSGQFFLTAKNIAPNEQPVTIARWPISSSIPIYISGHTPNSSYNIKLDNNDIGLNLATNSFGNTLDAPKYFVGTYSALGGKTQGNSIVFSSGVASATVNLTKGQINIASDIEGVTTHPEDDLLNIVLRDLAPLQQYTVVFDDKVTDPLEIQADENGVRALSYVVPAGVHTPGEPPVFVQIAVRDRGRGDNPNNIAVRTAIVETPLGPYLNVRGGAIWPAGSGIVIQVRQHGPNTPYDMFIEQGSAASPSLSDPVDQPVQTNANGAADINHIIPPDYEGFYTIRTFETGTRNLVADFEIRVTSQPFITIEGGNRWPPGVDITINLLSHAPNFEYDVYLDRGGSQSTFVGSVIMDDIGDGTIDFSIPDDIPFKSNPGYPLFSYLGSNVAADNAYLEILPTNLEVTKIDLPSPVILDSVVPITLTVRNSSAITITNTFFDTDIYVDPDPAPSLGRPLPPGQYKNWLSFMPPNSTVTINDEIVLFGPDDHTIYGRVDTSDYVTEVNEGDNMLQTVVESGCRYEIRDDFTTAKYNDPTFWTQTSYGDALGACLTLPDLPQAGGGGATVVVETKTWPTSGNFLGFDPQADAHPYLGTSGSSGFADTSSCCGSPPLSFYVGPSGAKTTPSSVAGVFDFTTSQPNVTITFNYVLRLSRLDSNESAQYIVFVEDSAGSLHVFDGGSGSGALVSATGNGNTTQDYPVSAGSTNWPQAVMNLTLPAGTHTFYFAAKSPSISASNEYALAYIDNFRIEQSAPVVVSGPPANPPNTILATHYDSGADSYSFSANAFRGLQSQFNGTVSSSANPTGSHDNTTSAWANVSGNPADPSGSLRLTMGYQGSSGTYTDMTGAWQRTFTVPAGSGCVTIQGYYWLDFADGYDSGEETEVLLAVDNVNEPRVLTSAQGSGGAVNTGWVAFSQQFSLLPGQHTLYLGGFNNRATASNEISQIWFDSIYIVDTSAGGGATQSESGGVLTMSNAGSSALFANDSSTGAGYHLLHQTVGSGPFTAWVKLDRPSQNGPNEARAGLEIRASADPTASKLMFVFRDDGRLEVLSRASGFTANNERTDNIGNGSLPIWLRVKRNGNEFRFHYSTADTVNPPTTWIDFETVNNLIMPDSVEVGMLNAPGAGVTPPSTDSEARFKAFRVCTNTQTPNTVPGTLGQGVPLGTRCGSVEEAGNGLAVLDAVNTILNQSGGDSWQEVSRTKADFTYAPGQEASVLGEPFMDGLVVSPDSGDVFSGSSGPHVSYAVNVQTGGTYYIHVAGWGPDGNGNSVNVGVGGVVTGLIDGFPTGSTPPGWLKMPGSVTLSGGATNIIDIWGVEDGTQIFKIMVTQFSDFVPPPDGMAQSACTIAAEPHIPPGLQQCSSPIQFGNFEGTFFEVNSVWSSTDFASPFSVVGSGGSNRGASLPAFGGRNPAIAQNVDTPTWLAADTVATLKYDVGVFQRGGPSPSDVLTVELSRVSDGQSLFQTKLADGDDLPELNPTLNDPANWKVGQSLDLFASVNPLSKIAPGDRLRIRFFSVDPAPPAGNSTEFFLDNLSLQFCTVEAEPPTEAGNGRVSGKTVRQSGEPILGAKVWAYKVNGPVYETYSIQEGRYSFVNLPPGDYLIYAQVKDPSGTLFQSQTVTVGPGSDLRNIILVLNTS